MIALRDFNGMLPARSRSNTVSWMSREDGENDFLWDNYRLVLGNLANKSMIGMLCNGAERQYIQLPFHQ